MNKNFTKEELFRLYEQSEFSDILYSEGQIKKQVSRVEAAGNKFAFISTLVSAGVLAGAVSLITILRRCKLF